MGKMDKTCGRVTLNARQKPSQHQKLRMEMASHMRHPTSQHLQPLAARGESGLATSVVSQDTSQGTAELPGLRAKEEAVDQQRS